MTLKGACPFSLQLIPFKMSSPEINIPRRSSLDCVFLISRVSWHFSFILRWIFCWNCDFMFKQRGERQRWQLTSQLQNFLSLSDSLAHLKKEYSEFQVEVLLLHLLERLVVVPHGATRGAKGAATMDGMGADGMGGGWEGEGGRMWERSWQGGGGQSRQGWGRWSTQGQLEAQSTSPLLLSRDQHWLWHWQEKTGISYLWRCWERERGARVAWRKVHWVGEKMTTGRIHGVGLLLIFWWMREFCSFWSSCLQGARYCSGHKTRQVLITVTAIWGRVRLNRSANGDLVDFFKNAGTFPVMRCKCITIARISLHFSETGDIYTQLVMNTLRPQHCRNIAIKKVVWKTQFLHFFVRHPENEVAQSIPASCFRKNGCFHKDAVILIRGYLCALSAYPAQSSV